MEDINGRFSETDVTLVVGANDVVNPAARTNPASPIFGMLIQRVSDSKSVIVLNRGRGAGFSGVENDLFFDPKTSMLFGDLSNPRSISRLRSSRPDRHGEISRLVPGPLRAQQTTSTSGSA
jgi:NAD/NADP transhydrogenase beta subunit